MTAKRPPNKNLIQRLKQVIRNPPTPPGGRNKAIRAAELNDAISALWQAEGTRSKTDFQAHTVPLYAALLDALKRHMTPEAAEQCLLELLSRTASACRHRWTLRLPMKRPGSDYRKYEILYTDALVTAMAVGCLTPHTPNQSPAQLAENILPKASLARLQADPIVWEDWLGFFEQAERGGLYAVSRCTRPEQKQPHQAPVPQPPTTPKEPPAGSGRAMLEAIRTGLADGALSCNQPGDPVQVDREGRTYLVHPQILEWCKGQLALEDDTKRLANRFSRQKVFKRSAGGNVLYRGRLRDRDAYSQGYLVENAAVLWREEAPPGRFVIENITARR